MKQIAFYGLIIGRQSVLGEKAQKALEKCFDAFILIIFYDDGQIL